MTKEEAAQKLVAVLNEIGAAGIQIEAEVNSLCLGAGNLEYTHVWPANQAGTVWEGQ